MKIYYYSNAIEPKLYEKLYTQFEKPGMQVQTFNNQIIDGLISNGVSTTALSSIPASKSILKQTFLSIQKNGIYHYFKVINIPLLKDIYLLLSSYFKTLVALSKDKEIKCVVDVLCASTALGASLACKQKRRDCVGILTDLPEHLTTSTLFIKMVYQTLQLCNKYVFLTSHMNTRCNPLNKPAIIVEGLYQETVPPQNKKRNNYIVYAGSLDKVNGIETLIKAFKNVKTDYHLYIYGSGDYHEELTKLNSSSIHYFGLKPREEVLEKLHNASFLINPRSTTHEAVLYSFPSKTMEYLASGTPFMCTHLPCLTSDYLPYLNIISDTPEAMAKDIEDILNKPYDALLQKANTGRNYILSQKNNIQQTKKIIQLLEN